MAKEILNTYFQNIKEKDDIKWSDFDTKIDNWIKDQKIYEKNILLNKIFVDEHNLFRKSKEISISDIENEIINMIYDKLEGNKTSIYYNICVSKKEEKTSEWINGVIPTDEKERELYKNIIIYSLYDDWKVKKTEYINKNIKRSCDSKEKSHDLFLEKVIELGDFFLLS